MTTTEPRPGPSMKLYIGVWLGLILIVATEVLLAYAHLRPAVLLMALLALALVEAGAALLVFMHLKYERPTLFWSLIPALIFVLVLMDHLWPDALRLTSLRAP